MNTVKNYILGNWEQGSGVEYTAHHAITGEAYAEVSSQGLDFEAILNYGRTVGGPALRKMTFQERGRMLKALALHLNSIKRQFYDVSWATGATKMDSWIDIEGGIGNLFANASLRRQFPDLPYYVDGELARLSKEGTFIGHHIMVPRRGVAVHINAFNFPIWGMLEKIAVNLMAGMPAVVKPSEYTSYLTEVMVKAIIDSKILPEGALQLVSGKGHGIIDHVDFQDVVTFTGSAATGQMLRGLPHLNQRSVPFNLEADSLNAAVLGPDVTPEDPEFALFVREIASEMTVKAGQKCTAIRRAMVPEHVLPYVQDALIARLQKTVIGDPQAEGVRMGALATHEQIGRVEAEMNKLMAEQDLVYNPEVNPVGATTAGAFYTPKLFVNTDPMNKTAVHEVEPFGPVSTLMPYKTIDEAVELTAKGRGSLVTSFVSKNTSDIVAFTTEAAAFNGRIHIVNEKMAKESTGHGSPMPLMKHGGPGRAGGGEEMGGKRGVLHYLHRTAVQGHPDDITAITSQYQPGAARPEAEPHVFRQHFEELQVGATVYTAKHTVTETDITNFANVSGDNFYAHMDATSLEGTIFEGRVAHGYFILSKAAGLFVDAKKGPVLLNYGIDEARFTKPVYPGTTIGVRFTVKEKIDQEKRSEDDVAKGIVKFYVEVYDDTDEVVAVATILTMVKKIDQA
ncbi:MAG: phenylacetic acid degradation bifunctional protein PaaZ [Schleiferiaceae bacterium]